MFPEIKNNFGFGCMRLPMNGNEVDYKEFSKMIDYFISEGFNYFDTAHGYLQGKSETAIRDCLVSRYPRESYVLTNKLTAPYFKTEKDVRPFFESQLKICGVDYFDFYLMHAQCKDNFPHFCKCRAYEQALEFKAAGKIRHLGISFHDSAEMLDEILTKYPQVEVVQLQFNYLDYDDPVVQSAKCYDVCRKHNKPVIVMEPVKGGSLVNLPDEALAILRSLNGGSAASYAIRFAAGFDGIFMTLSGMSNMTQMLDNLSFMKQFKPLDDSEKTAVEAVRNAIRAKNAIACTSCRYCVDGCPKNIPIPDLFDCMNKKKVYCNAGSDELYKLRVENKGKASDCIKCGKCEKSCPQHLPIRELLENVTREFEK